MTDVEREALARLEPLIEYVREMDHEESCPQDDTCEFPELRRLWKALDYAMAAVRERARREQWIR